MCSVIVVACVADCTDAACLVSSDDTLSDAMAGTGTNRAAVSSPDARSVRCLTSRSKLPSNGYTPAMQSDMLLLA